MANDENLISAIKNIFKGWLSSDQHLKTFKCLDCEKEWNGAEVELFIKHQIDEKHFNYTRYSKPE